MSIAHWLHALSVENFNEITLFVTVKEIEAILCFAIFEKKKVSIAYFWDTLGAKNVDEIAQTFKETEAILCFATFGKNSKTENGLHSILLRYAGVRKFHNVKEIKSNF